MQNETRKHQPVLDQFFKVVDSYKSQPKAYYEHLAEIMEPRYIAEDEIQTYRNDIVDRLYFLASGFAITFYYNDAGERQITHIYQHNDLIRLKSFTDQTPSLEALLFCKDAFILSLTHVQMQKIYAYFPAAEELSRLVMARREQKELEYRQLVRKETQVMVKEFYQTYPGLSEPGKVLVDADISSYLLISTRTLQACRAKLRF